MDKRKRCWIVLVLITVLVVGFSCSSGKSEKSNNSSWRPKRKEREKKASRVNLRSKYITLGKDDEKLGEDDAKSMLKKHNFFDRYKNETGDFANEYELKVINGDKMVIDNATGLMWHQSGSSDNMKWNEAKDWVRQLNRRGYTGYYDWRLPTVEEGASLLESSKRNDDLYIDPVFDKELWAVWTGDRCGSHRAWVIYFGDGGLYSIIGCVNWDGFASLYYVRPVRSGK